jgi:tRNA(Ile)-lysidine synthetase-like protein
MSDAAREDDSCFDGLTSEFLSEYNITDGIPTESINALHPSVKNRVFIKLFGRELESVHVKALARLCLDAVPHSSLSLPERKKAVIESSRLTVTDDKQEELIASPFCVKLVKGEHRVCEGFAIYVSDNATNIYKSETQVAIASDKICGELYARNRVTGDRILMGGMHKSLKKLMCDNKIDLALRDKLPIICDSEGIVFVPFIGVCDRVKTKKNKELTYIYLISG